MYRKPAQAKRFAGFCFSASTALALLASSS